MVQSTATTVDAWLAEVAPDRREVLERLRALCRDRLAGWTEQMAHGMPAYAPPGTAPRVSFNSQRQHVAFYPGEEAIAAVADRLAGADCGKGCVRYRKPEQIDFAVVAEILDHVRMRSHD